MSPSTGGSRKPGDFMFDPLGMGKKDIDSMVRTPICEEVSVGDISLNTRCRNYCTSAIQVTG
jgi:hypothetical protein